MSQDKQLIEMLQLEMRAGFALLADGIGQTNVRLDQTNASLTQTNAKLDQTNSRIDQTNAKLDQTVIKLDQTIEKVELIGGKLDQTVIKLDQTIDKVEQISGKLDQTVEELHEFRSEVNTKLNGISSFLLSSEGNVGRLEKRIVKLEVRMNQFEDKPRPPSN